MTNEKEQVRIATRQSYGEALKELGSQADNLVVLDADLANATKTCLFRDAFPERHIDCGIAEANMMDVAAGLSTTGLVPFASTFAMFAAGRAFEQIRNTIGYPHLNVKIGATHGGLSVGEDGASHQCLEDIALMRTIPQMTIFCPVDDPEARAMVKAAYELDGPVYIRFSRQATPIIHGDDYQFEPGHGEILRKGKDIAIVSTGILSAEALEACDLLADHGIEATLIHMGTIKPLDEELLVDTVRQVKGFVTVEEHNIIGGLGDAVCDTLSEHHPLLIKRLGVRDVFGHSGPGKALLHECGLDAQGIADSIEKWMDLHPEIFQRTEGVLKTAEY